MRKVVLSKQETKKLYKSLEAARLGIAEGNMLSILEFLTSRFIQFDPSLSSQRAAELALLFFQGSKNGGALDNLNAIVV